MSAAGDFRDRLEEMADLDPPMTDREMTIASWLFDENLRADLRAERDWYGDKACAMYDKIIRHVNS